MSKIITVIGGISSGKTEFAQSLCDNYSRKSYIATAVATDEEMENKIKKHKLNRADDYHCFENFDSIDKLIYEDILFYDICVLDCVSNMLSNLMYYSNIDFEICSNDDFEKFCKDTKIYIKDILTAMEKVSSNFVIVTNDMSYSVISANRYTRRFVQLQGEINQLICKYSTQVYFVTAGIANKIKSF